MANNGSIALLISGAMASGLNLAKPKAAINSSSKVQNAMDRVRRPFRFLRRGLKTGRSCEADETFLSCDGRLPRGFDSLSMELCA